MSKIFVKSSDLKLVNGGYCVVGKEETPVFNADFIAVQKHAEWVITFAEKAKGKDFEGKKADSIADVKAEVAKALASKKLQYVTPPTKVKGDLTTKLQAEALAFINFNGETTKVEKINEFLQGFNILNEFENFGLFFTQDIVKLSKIYTMQEVVDAVKEVIDLLD